MSWRANFRMVSGERTPWHPGGIAEVNDILPAAAAASAPHGGQPAQTGIEYADRPMIHMLRSSLQHMVLLDPYYKQPYIILDISDCGKSKTGKFTAFFQKILLLYRTAGIFDTQFAAIASANTEQFAAKKEGKKDRHGDQDE